ncbi:MAG: esterase family protein [Acidobacteriota bacterium]|nr:esterase family protein [Acidobacteriota bacterium]
MTRPLLALVILLHVLSIQAFAGHRSPASVETIQFQSKLVNTTLPYNVILPRDYKTSRTTRYPVLYLLHGLTGHYNDWIARTNIADYAAQYRLIVVMPEGNNSWYIDSATVPTDKYESYILQELIPDVQRRYRTIEARYGRAIAGLSMGGYGAFKFGLKYPDRFAFAGSMSGAFGVTNYTEKETGTGAAWETFLKLFGPAGSETRKKNDLFELFQLVAPERVTSLPYFYFDCGTEDAPVILNSNHELDERMLQKKIPHEYRELPGNHSWAYWDSQVQEVLKIAAQKIRLPAALIRNGKSGV